MRDWPDHPYLYSGGVVDPPIVNVFPPDPAGDAASDAKRRGRAAANMCWELAPDEALIVEFDAHDGFWMLSMMGAFFNSMDYLYRPVSYTPARTAVDATAWCGSSSPMTTRAITTGSTPRVSCAATSPIATS